MAVTGAADGSIIIEASLDTSPVDKGFSKIQKQANGLSQTLSKLGKLMASAFAIGAIVKFGKEAIELGSNVQEVQNVVDVAFGDMTNRVQEFADTAITRFGMSELAAKKTASTYMAMAKGMGIADEAAAEMALSLTGLTGDVASFYNISQELADTKLKSVFTGETETLKDLGIVMTEANLAAFALSEGITKSYKDMSQSEKVMLRYNYVTKQLSLASGDFARTQDSWANQTRILSMQWQEFMSVIGSALITILTPLVKMLNSLLQYLIAIGERINSFVSDVFGITSQGSDAANTATNIQDATAGAAENQNDLTDAVKETAKEQKKAVAGFDEIEKLTNSAQEAASETSSDIGVGGIVGGGSQPVGNTDATSVFDGISEKIRGFLSEFSTVWNDISALGSPISAWFTEDFLGFVRNFAATLADTLGLAFSGIGSAFNELWTTVLFPTLSRFTTEGLPKVTEFLNMALTNFSGFRDSVALVLGNVWNLALLPMLQTFSTMGLPMLEDFTGKVVGAFNNLYNESKALFDLIWQEAIAPALTQISIIWDGLWSGLKAAWDTWGQPIFDGINTAINGTAAFLTTMWNEWIKPVWDTFMLTLDEIWTNHLKPLWDKVTEFVGHLAAEALNVYNKFILPILNWLSKVLKPLWDFWWDNIFSVVKTAFASITALISPLIDAFKGLVTFISGLLTGDFGKAFEGIKEFFRGLLNTVIGFFEGFVNFFVEAINLVTGGISLVSGAVGDLIGVDLRIPEVQKVTLPRLATGGVIPPNREFLAVLGDQKSGTNIEAPLDTIVQAMQIALANGNGGSKNEAVFEVDGNVFARMVYKYGNRESNRIGVSLAGGMA